MTVPSNWSETLRQYIRKWKAVTDRAELEKYWGDRPFDNFVLTEHARSWDEYLQWVDELEGSWCFRGQRESSWALDTSLDRAVLVEHSGVNSSGYFHLNREDEQRELFLHFQVQAHDCAGDFPQADDVVSWLAFMQHHGVPTRLLDWTTSAQVALYFAVAEEASEPSSAVWAIDLHWLRATGHELLSSEEPTQVVDLAAKARRMNRLLRYTEKPVIVPIEPEKLNDRIMAQQGILLCRLFHETTFSQMLMSMMIRTSVPNTPVVRKLTVDKCLRIDLLKRLRELGIHGAALFPGIDGIGQFLKTDLEIKVKDAQADAAREERDFLATCEAG